MQQVLVVLFSYAGINKIIGRLADLLSEDDSLFVVGVVIQEISPTFSSLISDLGFLGDKVVSDVQEAVGNIYQENAARHLEDIKDEFNRQGIDVVKKKVDDDNLAIIDNLQSEKELDKIIINYTNNKYITHSVIDTKVKEILNKKEISAEIYYDGIK